MSHQSETILEVNLIKQLIGLDFESVKIHDGDAFISSISLALREETNYYAHD